MNSAAEGTGTHAKARWQPLLVIVPIQLLMILDSTIVTIALPSAQRDLGLSIAGRQWVLTSYSMAVGGLLLVGPA